MEVTQHGVGQHIGLETDLFCKAFHFVLGLDSAFFLSVMVGLGYVREIGCCFSITVRTKTVV